MKATGNLGCLLAVTLVIATSWGCRSGSKSHVSQTPTPDPTASIAVGPSSVAPQYYSGGPQTLPMRSDPSYANDVVSIAKKENLNTHKPPTPVGPQGSGSRPY